MSEPDFSFQEDSVTIIGVGLIGGSIGAALQARDYPGKIIGVGRNVEKLEDARQRGLVDECQTDLETAARKSRFLVFCTPVTLITEQIHSIAQACQPGTVITDAGSTKSTIVNSLRGTLPEGVSFVGSHPIAGSQEVGHLHADAGLYQDRLCVLTPTAETPRAAIQRVWAFWKFLGMQLREMPAAEHDEALAFSSHLPHLVASALVNAVPPELLGFTGSGFRKTTRLATGDPVMWDAICRTNVTAIVDALDAMTEQLGQLRIAVRGQDSARLLELLENARKIRLQLD